MWLSSKIRNITVSIKVNKFIEDNLVEISCQYFWYLVVSQNVRFWGWNAVFLNKILILFIQLWSSKRTCWKRPLFILWWDGSLNHSMVSKFIADRMHHPVWKSIYHSARRRLDEQNDNAEYSKWEGSLITLEVVAYYASQTRLLDKFLVWIHHFWC